MKSDDLLRLAAADDWDDDEEPGMSQSDVDHRVGRDVVPIMEGQGWTTVYHHDTPGMGGMYDPASGREYNGPGYHFEKYGPAGIKSLMSYDFHPVNGNHDDQEPGWHLGTWIGSKVDLPAGMTPSKFESFVNPHSADYYHTQHMLDIGKEVRDQFGHADEYGFTYQPREESAANQAYLRRDLGVGEVSHKPEHVFPEGVNHNLFQRLNAAGRTTIYHLTDDPRFKLNADFAPEDNSISINPRDGRRGLYVGRPEQWSSPPYNYKRPYVAELSMPTGTKEGGRWGNESFIPAESFGDVRVERVMPYDHYVRREFSSPGETEEHTDRTYDTGEPLTHTPGRWSARYPESVDTKKEIDTRDPRQWSDEQHSNYLADRRDMLHKVYGWGWNEFNDDHSFNTDPDDDPSHYDDNGEFIRRDRNGDVMTRGRYAATKKPKPKKPRKPEEVWYDVHKHPAGVPGGMGKSPEYHLRNRGWNPHEIHGAGSKTVQYRNPDHPDFAISFGGASNTHPDHNFRVLYMGTNRNIPKVNQAYSVAEAMNKVDELHEIHRGHIVLPMTHDSATRPPATLMGNKQPTQRQPRQFMAPAGPPNPPVTAPTYQLGKPKAEFPSGHTRGETNAQNPNKDGEVNELPKAPAPTQNPVFSRKPKQAYVLELAQQSNWEQE